MHLLLGDPQDPFCLRLRDVLEASNYPTRIISNPLTPPSRFVWQLNNEHSTSRLVWDDEPPMFDNQITGVLVRSTGWIDPHGWQPDDFAYMQMETQATLLAWLWSLACPVVNRYPSGIWYRPRVPLLSWQLLLRRCGLLTLETLVTNEEQEARAFGKRYTKAGLACAVYGSLNSDVHYLVTGDEDWSGLAAMQRLAPICLTYPHGAAQFVCVVGEQVVWEGELSLETTLLEPALLRFSKATGLSFVELAFAPTSSGISVIAVEPYPCFDHFGDIAQQKIVEGIVLLLTS